MKNSPTISMIVAIADKTRAIGTADGRIPWHIKEDFQYFKEKTMGHPIIMGKNTFLSLGGRILPGRPHIVVALDSNFQAPEGVFLTNNIPDAIAHAKTLDSEEVFIIGGGQIYASTIDLVDRLYITLVRTDIDGPVKFPEYKHLFSKVVSSRKSRDENFEYEFLVLEK